MNFKGKKLFSFLILPLLLCMFTPAVYAVDTTNLSMGTASMTGTFYMVGSSIADVINREYNDVVVTAETTGGSVQNCRLLAKEEIQLSLLSDFFAKAVLEGTNPLFEKPIPIRSILPTHYSIQQWIVRKSSGIEKITDLKGKRVVVGPPGSTGAIHAQNCLSSSGLDDKKGDYKPLWYSYEEAVQAFKNKQTDCALFAGNWPISAILQIQSFADIDILQVNMADNVMKMYPYFKKCVIPANTYKGVDHSTVSIGVPSGLYCLANVDEEVVYKITKAVYENIDYLKSISKVFEFISLEKAKDVPIPLHPGAIKYLREKGIKF